MKENNDLLTIQVGSGIAAVVTFVVPYISAAFMLGKYFIHDNN